MTPKFHTLALTVMCLWLAVSAQAAPTVINIDFNALADAAKAAGAPANITNPVQGFSFTGAKVYHQSHVEARNYCCAPPEHIPIIGSGFILNRFSNIVEDVNTRIEVALAGALSGRDIVSMTFSFATGTTAMEFLAYDEVKGHRFGYFAGDFWVWTSQSGDFGALGIVNRIAFVSQEPNATFAIDNLSFTLADPVGGTLPEPAGLGLVALALATAGISRNKRRAAPSVSLSPRWG